MLNKYILAALALSLALLGGAGWLLKRSYAANGAQAKQITALNRAVLRAAEQRAVDIATLDRLAAKNAATARETASLRASLGAALTQNRAWADEPVPPEVQDALRSR